MSRSLIRSLSYLVAAAAATACASKVQQYGNSSGGEVDLASYPPAVLDGSEREILRQMSDGNIVGHMRTVDSLEVTTADSVLRFSKTESIDAYAKLMHLAHSDDMTELKTIEQQARLAPTVDVTSLKASHVAASLDSISYTSDLTIDHRYIASQIELHNHVLSELQLLQGVARRPAVRDHISAMIPVVQDHLARARAIAAARGYEKK